MGLSIDKINGEKYLKCICSEEEFCEEIGNVSLKRNRVFLITNNKVLKIYGEYSRWFREVNSLMFLQKTEISCPFLYSFGNNWGYNWVILSLMPGRILAEQLENNSCDKKAILYQLGIYHAHYHRVCSVNYYGDWSSFEKDKSYALFIQRFHQHYIESIKNDKRHDLKFFEKCFSLINSLSSNFEYRGGFTLCHNDFDVRNILVDTASGNITGLIDYERSFFAEPLFDMTRMLLLNTLEEIEVSPYLEGYEGYVGYEIDRKRLIYYLLLKSVQICSWSHITAYEYYLKAIRLLENILDRYY